MQVQVTIDGQDYAKYVPLPIKWSPLLDERLDEARLSLKHAPVSLFSPLTPARVTLNDGTDTAVYNWVVASDQATEVPPGSGFFNHELYLIEETKTLEGIIVDALTFTNSLGRDYTQNAKPIKPIVVPVDYENYVTTPSTYVNPIPAGNFTFARCNDVLSDPLGPQVFRLIVTNIGTGEAVLDSGWVPKGRPESDYPVYLNTGSYQAIYYDCDIQDLNYTLYKATYNLSVVENRSALPKWTIASVINRVLELAETRLKGTAPRFTLNAEQAAEFAKITAPEFAFTRATLKEILDQIGGFIHGIPRLRDNIIYYDMLGGTEMSNLAAKPYCTRVITQDIESYCSKLDSSVDNLVNIVDRNEGVITEPYQGGYKTVRTETMYARIEEGNMCVATQFPIQEIISVECGLLPGQTFSGGIITPYVFEAAEYKRMSSFTETYPYSKAYALYYTQGQKNIYGLDFKVRNATGGVFNNYAILNILEASTGRGLGGVLNLDTYPNLAFRVSYIPIFSARIEQAKQYIGDMRNERAIVYNQAANLVESRYYGENIKGVVARMGNAEEMRTYLFRSLKNLPRAGQLFNDDYYISTVNFELLPDFIRCSVGLSKDFNRLSQYIGINSTKRFYEVSEKQAYDRNIIYTDYCVVGDGIPQDITIITDSGVQAVADTFTQQNAQAAAVSAALAKGTNASGDDDGQEVVLPVISTALGDAVVFTFTYEDNYSAGQQSLNSTNSRVSGYFTQNVPYGNYYGRIEYLGFNIAENGYVPTTSDEQSGIGRALPQNVRGIGVPLISCTDQPLVVQKDGAEILTVNYQLEYVTNRKNLILGSALSRNCPLVRGYYAGHAAKLYVLPSRISKFANEVDLTGATLVADYGATLGKISVSGKAITIANERSAVDGAAWVIVDGASGELLIGCNALITAGQPLQLPTLTFAHRIFV